jgi:hypothetical protein
LILAAKAPASVWKVNRSPGGAITSLEKKTEYVYHYSFHIMDPALGTPGDQDVRAPGVGRAGDPHRRRRRGPTGSRLPWPWARARQLKSSGGSGGSGDFGTSRQFSDRQVTLNLTFGGGARELIRRRLSGHQGPVRIPDRRWALAWYPTQAANEPRATSRSVDFTGGGDWCPEGCCLQVIRSLKHEVAKCAPRAVGRIVT